MNRVILYLLATLGLTLFFTGGSFPAAWVVFCLGFNFIWPWAAVAFIVPKVKLPLLMAGARYAEGGFWLLLSIVVPMQAFMADTVMSHIDLVGSWSLYEFKVREAVVYCAALTPVIAAVASIFRRKEQDECFWYEYGRAATDDQRNDVARRYVKHDLIKE